MSEGGKVKYSMRGVVRGKREARNGEWWRLNLLCFFVLFYYIIAFFFFRLNPLLVDFQPTYFFDTFWSQPSSFKETKMFYEAGLL